MARTVGDFFIDREETPRDRYAHRCSLANRRSNASRRAAYQRGTFSVCKDVSFNELGFVVSRRRNQRGWTAGVRIRAAITVRGNHGLPHSDCTQN